MALQVVDKPEAKTGGIAADRLRSLVERIERLEEERKALGSDIKDIYAEAKSAGFDVKVLRQLFAFASRNPMTWRSRRRCSMFTAVRWACRRGDRREVCRSRVFSWPRCAAPIPRPLFAGLGRNARTKGRRAKRLSREADQR